MLLGGAGEDLADYTSHAQPVALSLDGLANDGAAGEGENLGADIENLRGGSGDDTLTGDARDNVLDGGRGADTIAGGAGTDTADYSSRQLNVRVDLSGSPGDDGEYLEGDTVGADVESAVTGSGQDYLIGNAAGGRLAGGEGDDLLVDRGGEDVLDGGWGRDTIDSADGARDTVACGFGEDDAWRDAADDLDGCETLHDGPIPDPLAGRSILSIGTFRPPVRVPVQRLPGPSSTARRPSSPCCASTAAWAGSRPRSSATRRAAWMAG